MAAPTKNWTVIADGAIDPDSPLDNALFTAIRDNQIHLEEWLGGSFTAAIDHNHDGVNSTEIGIGPALNRNGSFEDGLGGWTFTDFTGGSHAIDLSNNQHGVQGLAITSTVLANGGGDAETSNIICAGGDVIPIKLWYKASVINVSSKVELDWYEEDGSTIITTSVVNTTTNTPTAATRIDAGIIAPASARFYRIVITGGIPATGTAVGTIYFDGIITTDFALISQNLLKTTTAASVKSVPGNNQTTIPLVGGTYSWWTWSSTAAGGYLNLSGGNTAAGVNGIRNSIATAQNVYWDERYITASPPYNIGDGDIPLFVFLMLDEAGETSGVSVAPDPPWAYHGPTNILTGEQLTDKCLSDCLHDKKLLDQYLKNLENKEHKIIPPGHERKNADMHLHPQPFGDVHKGHSVILLDPFSKLCSDLYAIQQLEGAWAVRKAILDGAILLDNKVLKMKSPPGVMPVNARWKLTG